MKPTYKQIQLMDQLKKQISFWQHTNDLSSPTHVSDIDEFLQTLDLTTKQQQQIKNKMRGILNIIRKLDEDK